MISRLMALLIAGLFVVPLDADARGWSWRQLGTVDTKSRCLDKAEAVFAKFKTLQVDRANDGVTGYGVNGIDVDAVITCGRGTDGRYVAVLVLHSWDGGALNQTRLDMIDKLRVHW